MIVREWSGTVPTAVGDDYLELMRRRAVPDYFAVQGNRDAQVWHRPEEDGTVRFTVVSWWDSLDAVQAFAGEDVDRARYYDFDERFLVDRGPRVRHHAVADPL